MHIANAIYFIIVAIIWIALAFWPARVAARKGYSFLLFFLLSVIISFLLVLIIAYVLPDKTGRQAATAPAAPAADEE